jgi:NAD(P)H-hydrate epimerase
MQEFNPSHLKNLYVPSPSSHKGENGKLLIIGGSTLFHAASLWALTVASRIVDMVFYSSVPMNNKIVENIKTEFRNGIIIPRGKIEDYIQESDCVLIGPGLPRPEGQEKGDDDTRELTTRLLKKYRDKRWVIDGGSLQVITPDILPKDTIVTPHKKEFEKLFGNKPSEETVAQMAKQYGVIILLKGEHDMVSSPIESVRISGGNSGMTKGGTGDVLAGLTAALYCKNDAFLSACAASYINKKAGESLFKKVSYYFNASDLADEIPLVMKEFVK